VDDTAGELTPLPVTEAEGLLADSLLAEVLDPPVAAQPTVTSTAITGRRRSARGRPGVRSDGHDETSGGLAGVIGFLTWPLISTFAIPVDAELERGRAIARGYRWL